MPPGGLLDIFTGGPDPRLSAEQNEQLRRQALVQGGLTGLLASGRGEGLLSTIGLSGLAGREARQRLAEAAAPTPLEEPETQVVTRPDGTMALISKRDGATIAELGRPPEEDQERPEPVRRVRTISGDVVNAAWDPKIGAYRGVDGQILPGATPTPDPERGVATTVVDPGTGRQFTIFVDPTTGEQIGVARLSGLPAQEDTKLTPEEFERAETAVISRDNFDIINDFLRRRIEISPDNPLRGIRFQRARFEETGLLVPFAFRQQLDTETQQFLQAQEAFMLKLANDLAGVRGISQQQAREAVFRTFGFEEGDSVENILNTLNELENRVVSSELQAGQEAIKALREARRTGSTTGSGLFDDLIPGGGG